jgi:hypothetical protein
MRCPLEVWSGEVEGPGIDGRLAFAPGATSGALGERITAARLEDYVSCTRYCLLMKAEDGSEV